MGCSVSKMEDDGVTAAVLSRPMRRRIEEIRRRRMLDGGRVRKDSIVSTTQLLRREEEEDATTVATEEEVSRGGSLRCDGVCSVCGAHPSLPRESNSSTTPPTMTIMPAVAEVAEGLRIEDAETVAASRRLAGESEEIEEEEQEKKKSAVEGDEEADEKDEMEREEEQGTQENGREEEQKGEVYRGAALVGSGGAGRLGYDEEDQPGSPSFRVYFVESLRESSDDDSAVSNSGKTYQKERKSGANSATSEDSAGKSTKKHGGRRLKALKKGRPNPMNGLWNVRFCYSHGDHGPNPNPNPNQNQNPASLTEKVA